MNIVYLFTHEDMEYIYIFIKLFQSQLKHVVMSAVISVYY